MMTTNACPACGLSFRRSLAPAKGYWLLRCGACGLSRVDPVPDAAALEHYYSRVYSLAVDAERVNVAGYEQQAEELTRTFARLAPGAATICEVGCSGGWALASLQRRGYKVKGYELSATTSRLARDRYGLDVVTGEFTAAGETFDIIVMRHVLEHMVEPEAQLAAVASRLSAGGLLFLVAPNGGGLSHRLLGQYWSWYIPPAHIWYFTADSLVRLVGAAGLTVRGFGSRQGDANALPVELAAGAARWARQRLRGSPGDLDLASPVRERLRTRGAFPRMLAAANTLLSPISRGAAAFGLGDELWLAASKT